MAIALGVFQDRDQVVRALELLNQQGISSRDIALVVRDEQSKSFVRPITVSGFLRSDLGQEDIRMVEGMVLTSLVNAGIDMFEAVAYMKAVKRGYTLLAVRTKDSVSPWAAEAMRRSEAIAAIDSATEHEMAALPYTYRQQYFAAHRALIR